MNERERALKRVAICKFAALEAALFLDSHPDDQDALSYFNKYRQLSDKAVYEYESKYGPLTHGGSTSEKSWDWVKTPWPWEI
jgi:spore coat protein JB